MPRIIFTYGGNKNYLLVAKEKFEIVTNHWLLTYSTCIDFLIVIDRVKSTVKFMPYQLIYFSVLSVI